MTFEEAAQRYAYIRQQRDVGQLADPQFREQVGQLTVIDEAGSYWQIDPDTGQWMTYVGDRWVVPAAASGEPAGAVHLSQPVTPASEPANTESALNRAVRAGAGKSEGWWGITSIIGGAIAGALWYWYSSLDKGARPDLRTSEIMVAVPILLMVLRKPIDMLLAPTMKFRRHVPRMVIVGVGLAVPYMTASCLYKSQQGPQFLRGLSEYPYIRWVVFIAPILSYLIMRTPNVAPRVKSGGRVD